MTVNLTAMNLAYSEHRQLLTVRLQRGEKNETKRIWNNLSFARDNSRIVNFYFAENVKGRTGTSNAIIRSFSQEWTNIHAKMILSQIG